MWNSPHRKQGRQYDSIAKQQPDHSLVEAQAGGETETNNQSQQPPSYSQTIIFSSGSSTPTDSEDSGIEVYDRNRYQPYALRRQTRKEPPVYSASLLPSPNNGLQGHDGKPLKKYDSPTRSKRRSPRAKAEEKTNSVVNPNYSRSLFPEDQSESKSVKDNIDYWECKAQESTLEPANNRVEKSLELKDASHRNKSWLLQTVRTFDSGLGRAGPARILYGDQEDDDFEISFEEPMPPPPEKAYQSFSDTPAEIITRNSASFDLSRMSTFSVADVSYEDPIMPRNIIFPTVNKEVEEVADERNSCDLSKRQTFSTDEDTDTATPTPDSPQASYSTKEEDEKQTDSQRPKVGCMILGCMVCFGLLACIAFFVMREMDFTIGRGSNLDADVGAKVSSVPSLAPSKGFEPTLLVVPSAPSLPSSFPTSYSEPSKFPSLRPSSVPTITASASPTVEVTKPFSIDMMYDIIISRGLVDTIVSDEYTSDLIESMNLLVLEVEANIPGRRQLRGQSNVVQPTEISRVHVVECPRSNGIDRCEAITSTITLIEEEGWEAFRTTLSVAIAIGRLQYHLDRINSESPIEVIGVSDETLSPISPEPSSAPVLAPSSTQPIGFQPSISDAMFPLNSTSDVPSQTSQPTSFQTGNPGQTESTYPTSRPIIAATPAPFSLFDLLASRSFDGGEALHDANTPQHRAYMWLAGSRELESYSPQRILQRYAMATLYYSTNGDTWFFNDDWLSNKSECLWYSRGGTSNACNDWNELIGLELDYNNLDGILPPELGMLSNSLERIVLTGGPTSFLGGTLPSELGYLSLLERASFRGNALTGSIPSELGNWQNLQQLDISRNRLSGSLPTEIGQALDLTLLDMSWNDLTGALPTELGLLQKTTKLHIENNMLSGPIPSEIGLLHLLQDLSGGLNMFTSMPSEIGLLSFCDTLSFFDNDIRSEIPTEIGNLHQLRSLDLRNNALTGTIPSELGNLPDMRSVIDLSFNHLTGRLPSELGELDRLRILELHHNKLSGTIPSEFAALDRLTTIRLDSNDLTGVTPIEVCEVFNSTFPAFHADCVEYEDNCPCCTTCCIDEVGCECRYLGTPQEYLCFQQ